MPESEQAAFLHLFLSLTPPCRVILTAQDGGDVPATAGPGHALAASQMPQVPAQVRAGPVADVDAGLAGTPKAAVQPSLLNSSVSVAAHPGVERRSWPVIRVYITHTQIIDG